MDQKMIMRHREHFLEEISRVVTPNSVAVTEEMREGVLQAIAIAAGAVFAGKWNIPEDPTGATQQGLAVAAISGMQEYMTMKNLRP